ncbi:MAG: hypothetical protein VB128_06080 [Sedimentibacter saalensis]|jgi:hypothetical protein|uniref:hypothetical protein n=1 Tax=Sedimentibacter saalensis TaxID=130788 RepID=UPI0011A82898|nr:hypothetical protein [Sedimentibacter saalensis]MEA5094511.1 hypothetical protein [Sedimentibacter saalensis]
MERTDIVINHNTRNNIFVNVISQPGHVKSLTKRPVGTADTNHFCVFNNQSHAVGSVIKGSDGSNYVCTEDGSWQYED